MLSRLIATASPSVSVATAMTARRAMALRMMSSATPVALADAPAAAASPTASGTHPALDVPQPAGATPAVISHEMDVSRLTKGKVGVVLKTFAETKMNKTTVVEMTTRKINPKTGKARKWTKKYLCHDEYNVSKVDDLVRIELGRPRSKRKSWFVAEIVKRRLD
eukprot:a676638_76.p2 GENE.a676638_76~~a676638_76.p2  ORF type:complete len:175 (-),score=52.26 a676638_76:233-724(-)